MYNNTDLRIWENLMEYSHDDDFGAILNTKMLFGNLDDVPKAIPIILIAYNSLSNVEKLQFIEDIFPFMPGEDYMDKRNTEIELLLGNEKLKLKYNTAYKLGLAKIENFHMSSLLLKSHEEIAHQITTEFMNSLNNLKWKQDREIDEKFGHLIELCPITQCRITVPKVLKCGHKFEKDAVNKWLNQNHSCPICRNR